MAKKIIQAQMQQRRDTAAQWAAKNPVLLDGELGVVTDNPNSYKIGDGVTAWNDLPLRGFDGNIVQTLGNSATAVMSQKAITEQVAEQNAKLARLDQEWSEVKGQIEDAVLEVTVQAQPHIHKVIVTDGGAILEPDKFYDFGEAQQIVIGFAPAEEPHYVAQYAFQFKSPTDTPTILTMPEGVIFPVESDSAFQIKGGLTYQVTIVDNLAVATSWEV